MKFGLQPVPIDCSCIGELSIHSSSPPSRLAHLSAADYPVVVAGLHLPAIVPPDTTLHSMLWNAHMFLGLCFFALILLHLAAALFHAWVRRDGVFEAMSPASTLGQD